MSTVLGISAHYHDAAAAVVRDGVIVAAIQEERLSRIKNDPALPFLAARVCLELAEIEGPELDAVVFYEEPFTKLERVMLGTLHAFPRAHRQFPRAMAQQLGSKIWVRDQLSEGLGVARERVEMMSHHRSHAASAFWCSPFEEAAVLVVDAVGEHETTSIWRGGKDGLSLVESIHFPHSLGLLYAAMTAWLGFRVNEGEYKVMGLSAWGRPRFEEEFARLVQLHDDGSFELGLDYFNHFADPERGYGPKLEALLGPARPAGRPWDLASEADQRYADVAATLQATLERAMIGLGRRALRRTDCDALALAGGVALNAVANAAMARTLGTDERPLPIFVQPAAGDAGGALGAALELGRGSARPAAMTHCAWGQPARTEQAPSLARALGLEVSHLADPDQAIAERIARDEIVACVRGRFEWGPRALGQRSILANPASRATRDRLNAVIKKREPFRPFAPAVLAEHMHEYFDAEPDLMTPFMTSVAPITESARGRLEAVVHEDGSARVQSVDDRHPAGFHSLLERVRDATGLPVVLNTSLNGPGEPIAASVQDALAFFARYDVDALIIEDLLIERPSS